MTDGEGGVGPWSLEELRIAGSDNQRLHRYVLAFGRDHNGELFVLTTDNFTPTGGDWRGPQTRPGVTDQELTYGTIRS